MSIMRDIDRTLIEGWRIGYSEGNADCLLDALHWCFDRQLPIPAWGREGLLTAIERVSAGKVKGWDDVFGSAKQRKTKHRRWSIAHQVARAVKDQERGEVDYGAIGRAARPPVSEGTARKYYYEFFPRSGRDAIKSSKKPR
jgi:hypothetical protein